MTGTVQAFLSAAIAAGVSALGIWLSRRSAREANRQQKRLTDLAYMQASVETLKAEADELRTTLKDTRDQLEQANERAHALNEELDAAQHNVLVLSEHIRRYLPERPFPRDKLRPMNVTR